MGDRDPFTRAKLTMGWQPPQFLLFRIFSVTLCMQGIVVIGTTRCKSRKA